MDNNGPLQELEALMKYLVKHNQSHTQELEDLAVNLKSAGKLEAYEGVLAAIESYKKGNDELSSALEKITK